MSSDHKRYFYPVDVATVPNEDHEGADQTFHLIVDQLRVGYCTLNSENRLNFLLYVLQQTNTKLKRFPQTYYDERATTYFQPGTSFGHTAHIQRRERKPVQLPLNPGPNFHGLTSCISKNNATLLYVDSYPKCRNSICDRPIQDF